MKFLKIDKFKLIILVILVISFYFILDSNIGIDKRLKHSNQILQAKDRIISGIKKEVKTLKKEKKELARDKVNQLEKIREFEKQPVKTPGQIETIVVKEKEYVPKLEYVTLYALDMSIRKALNKYIGLDIKIGENNDLIISKLEDIEKERKDQVTRLTKDRDYFYRKARRKYSLVFGLGVGVNHRGDFSITIGITYGKRIF